MGWFSKKEDKENEIPGLPELPPSTNFQLPEAPPGIPKSIFPSPPELAGMELEVNSLPSLPGPPGLPKGKEPGQEMIKQAIYPDMQKSLPTSLIPP